MVRHVLASQEEIARRRRQGRRRLALLEQEVKQGQALALLSYTCPK